MGVAERRERERSERREAILDAAEAVFLKKGVAPTTMDEIAQRAELAKGTLYLYFASKDELFCAVSLRWLRELDARQASAAELGGTGAEVLERLARGHVEYVVAHRERHAVAVSWLGAEEPVGDSPEFEAYRVQVGHSVSRVVDAIRRGQGDGTLRDDLVPHEVALQLWGATNGVLGLVNNRAEVARRLPAPVDFDRLVPGFVELMLSALRREPQRPRALATSRDSLPPSQHVEETQP